MNYKESLKHYIGKDGRYNNLTGTSLLDFANSISIYNKFKLVEVYDDFVIIEITYPSNEIRRRSIPFSCLNIQD